MDATPNEFESSSSSPPAELRGLDQWVCYNPPSKIPLDAKENRNADSTDPETWAPYDVAASVAANIGLGVGFVFSATDPYVGIDLDKCRNPETGELSKRARSIVKAFDSYTEVSPSGTGLHIFIRGKVADAHKGTAPENRGIEIYGEERYFTVTGNRLGTTETIEERQDILDAFVLKYFPDSAEPSDPVEDGAGNAVPDDVLLAKMRGASNGEKIGKLLGGDWRGAGFASQSEADLSLCSSLVFWTNGDSARVDRLFRASGLMRPKWDASKGYYGRTTIRTAMASYSDGYVDRPLATELPSSASGGYDTARLMTIGEVDARVGAKDGWLVDRMLAVGDMSVVISQPGGGKSTLGGQLASAVSRGDDFLGRETKQGLVIYLAFEGARTVSRHLLALGHEPDDPNILMWIGDGNPKDPITWLRSTVGDLRPALIITDTLADFSSITHGAANSGYEETVGKLGPVYRWAQERKAHMLLFHHATTKRDTDGLDAALGSTGIVGKPGTVMVYTKLKRDQENSPRVLTGRKHRESEAGVFADLPPTVISFDPETRRLYVEGSKAEVMILTMGLSLIEALQAAGGSAPWQDLMDAVEGRKQNKLDALRRLTDVNRRVLVEDGKKRSRTDGLRYAINPDLTETPERRWRATYRLPLGSRVIAEPEQGGNEVEAS